MDNMLFLDYWWHASVLGSDRALCSVSNAAHVNRLQLVVTSLYA